MLNIVYASEIWRFRIKNTGCRFSCYLFDDANEMASTQLLLK